MRAPMNIRMRNRPLRVARDMAGGSLYPFGGFLVIIVLVYAGILLGMGVTGNLDTEPGSVWEDASFAVRYFPMAMGLMLPTAFMQIELTVGATRRDFALGAVVYATVSGFAMAVVMALGLWIESLVFSAAGAEHVLGLNHLAERPDQVGLLLLEYTITVTAHVLCGFLVGIAYWHTGGVIGTFLLPVTVLPAIAVDAVMDIGWTTAVLDLLDWSSPSATVGVVVAVLIAAITAYINYLLIRRAGV